MFRSNLRLDSFNFSDGCRLVIITFVVSIARSFVLAFCTFFIAVSGTVIDTLGASTLVFLDACVNFDGTQFTGISSFGPEAANCFQELSDGNTKACYCVGEGDTCAALIFTPDSISKNSCDYISSGKYENQVRSSSILVGVTWLLSFIYILISCVTITMYDSEVLEEQILVNFLM